MTTLVVYPDGDPESTTIDGSVRRSAVDEAFSTLRNGAGTNKSDNTTSIGPQVTASTTSNQFERISRMIVLFDTSSIGAADTISSVTLSLYGLNKGTGLGAFEVDIVSSAPASNTNLVAADYGNLGSTPLASLASASISTSAYNDFTLAAGDVTKAGISKLGARINWDTDNSFGGSWASGATSYGSFYAADQTGTTNDPKLTVVYTVTITAAGDLLDGAVTVLDPGLSHAVTADLLDGAMTVLDPGLSHAVTADLLDGAMTVLDPSLARVVYADLLDAALEVWEPTALQTWNVMADLLDGAVTVLEPTALQTWNVMADLLDGAMTVLDPGLSHAVTADLLDAAMTVLDPGLSHAVTADLLDAAMTVLAPSLSRVVYADLLDAALTMLEPAALQDWNVTGDLLDAVVMVWDASVSVGGLTTYGWILGSYNLMQAAHKIDLLGEYDGLAGRRGADLVVSGQEGRVWREKWHDERVIALRMYIQGDTRVQYQARIDALLAALGRSAEQTLRRGMADGSERQIDVRLNQALAFQPQSERFARMVVEFTATAPYWRQSDSTIVSVSGVAPGSLPYAFACNNSGSATDDAPVITITPTGGTFTNPRLTIGSTWVQYTGAVTSGQTLSIDAGAWTATKAAASVAASISSAKPDWLLIPAGNNTATLSGTLSAGTVAAIVTFYKRWH